MKKNKNKRRNYKLSEQEDLSNIDYGTGFRQIEDNYQFDNVYDVAENSNGYLQILNGIEYHKNVDYAIGDGAN